MCVVCLDVGEISMTTKHLDEVKMKNIKKTEGKIKYIITNGFLKGIQSHYVEDKIHVRDNCLVNTKRIDVF